MRTSAFILFLAKFNQAIKNKDRFFLSFYNLKIHKFILFLKENKLIHTYVIYRTIINNLTIYNIKIYLTYHLSKSLVQAILLRSTKKQVFTKKFYEILAILQNRQNQFSPLFILETGKGYLTHIQALKYKIGGKLLGILYL